MAARPHEAAPENTIAALDVIEADEPYTKLTEYLLGNVFITDKEDAITNRWRSVCCTRAANL